VFVTPIYLVNQLYNTHRGDVRLAVDVTNPYLDATASRSGNTIFIKAVNIHQTNSLTTTIRLRGLTPIGSATVETLEGPGAAIKTRSTRIGTQFVVTLPDQSVSIISIKIRVIRG
jgi:alpha-L-arabinofuranosidase